MRKGITRFLKKSVKGLSLYLHRGDSFIIEHAGEKMEMLYVGRTGTNQVSFKFIGPLAFNISKVKNRGDFHDKETTEEEAKTEAGPQGTQHRSEQYHHRKFV
jgi:hypothetical protein